jgi:hypothetical protein
LVPTHAAVWLFPSAEAIPDLAPRSVLGFGTETDAGGTYDVDIDLSAAGLTESTKGYLALVVADHDLALDAAQPGDQWYLHSRELSFGRGWAISLYSGALSLLPLTADDNLTPGDEREGVVACAEPCTTQCCGGTSCGYDACDSYVAGCDGAEDCFVPGDVCCVQANFVSCQPRASCTNIACHDTGDCEVPGQCSPNASLSGLSTCQ